MAQIEVNSFFTRGGIPAADIDDNNPHSDGKTYPRVRIWEVNNGVHTLVVGDTIGTGQNTDGIMVPGADTGIEDGFYTFIFDDTIGYDAAKNYLIRADGGNTLPDADRYQAADISPELTSADVSDAVWGVDITAYNDLDSAGSLLQLLKTTIDTVLKYDTNRTKIDPITKELIIYDSDCTTELRRFLLLDSDGVPSIDKVCERVPIDASDGKPICPTP